MWLRLKKKKLNAELANGRLAMMAIIGMFFQARSVHRFGIDVCVKATHIRLCISCWVVEALGARFAHSRCLGLERGSVQYLNG